ncbi:hypothetical protein LINPERHAP1_LOCUS29122 [Linum perenne]
MPLGDHTRTYLHQYTQLIKFSNAHKSTVHHITALTKSSRTRKQHLNTVHLSTQATTTSIHQPLNSQFTVPQSLTSTKHNPTNPSSTNPSSSIHNQVQLHLHSFIWTHTYSTMHTRHINHNHTLDKYITTTHSFIYVSSLGAIRSCSPATPPAIDAPTLPGGSKTHPQRIQIPWTSQSLPQELATNHRYSTKVIYNRRPDSILILGIQPR